MPEHPNLETLRRGYAAFATGDLDALGGFWTDDVRWHVPGRTQVSGTYEGPAQVLALFTRSMEATGGTFRAEPQALFADDDYGVSVTRVTAHRDGRSLEMLASVIARFRDGRVAEVWEAPTDPVALDEFWA